MRILAITNLFPSPWHPNRAPFNRQQFRALALQHELRIIAPVAWTSEWLSRRTSVESGHRSGRSREEHGIKVDHPRYLFPPRVGRAFYGECLRRSICSSFLRALNEMNPDVVLGCWAYPDGWAAVKLAREAGLPVVLKVHGSDVRTAGRRTDRRRATAEALSSADAVIAVSQDLSEGALKFGVDQRRVHIVHNGVDTALFAPGPRDEARRRLGIGDERPLILFVGNLVPVKGPDVLMESLARIARKGFEFQCAFLGEGALRRQLEARASKADLRGRVRLVDAQPQAELAHWYRAADLLAVPSRSEGIPNVLLEGATCGTPFVASAVGGIPEVAWPESLVPPEDPAALADAIARIITGPRRAPAIRAAPGSWADSARELASVLEAAVSMHASRRLAARA
jgi:glycosyltransferase involved in cell wall biosynthesis